MGVFLCAAKRRMVRRDQDAMITIVGERIGQGRNDVAIDLFQGFDFRIMASFV